MRIAKFVAGGAVLLTLLWSAEVGPRAQGTTSRYLGSAALFGLDRVTIVYPARGDSDRERNRLSAERRAAYLANKHGVEAAVASDLEITAEQRKGHLLLLGWDNGLIGTAEAPNPFGRNDSGRVFLGSIGVRHGEDLIFATPSPYNPKKRLVFWSRLDLELDRYLVIPFVGSDWAVYRDYTILSQGMFAVGAGWPPSRDPMAEGRAEKDRPALSAAKSSEHYTLHYVPASLGDEAAAAILEARESALEQAAGWLGSPGDGFRVDLFVYEDREIKQDLTSVADEIHNDPPDRELHMTRAHARTPSPHEEIHLLARERWGPCYYTALYEGLAIALERPGAELDVFAALFTDRDAQPTSELMLDEERLRVLTMRGHGFPAAGLWVSWLIERGGLDLVGRLYGRLPLDASTVAREVGAASSDGPSFDVWLSARAESGRGAYLFRAAHADARQHGEKEDWAAAAVALERALEQRPEDPETLYKLGLVLVRASDAEAAESTFRRLTALQVQGPDLRYVIHGHLQLASLLEEQERQEEARLLYRAVLDYPDRHASHAKAREGLERIGKTGL